MNSFILRNSNLGIIVCAQTVVCFWLGITMLIYNKIKVYSIFYRLNLWFCNQQNYNSMRKYIFTIVFMLLGLTTSFAQKVSVPVPEFV